MARHFVTAVDTVLLKLTFPSLFFETHNEFNKLFVTQKQNPCTPFLFAASRQPSIPELILNPARLIFCVCKTKSVIILE
jgi:hypothetical protein